jgi:hypothetical protein
MSQQLPGREIPKEYAKIVEHLVRVDGWRYDASGKKHPVVYPADRSQGAIRIPTTPGDRRSLLNFKAQVRRAGGTA